MLKFSRSFLTLATIAIGITPLLYNAPSLAEQPKAVLGGAELSRADVSSGADYLKGDATSKSLESTQAYP